MTDIRGALSGGGPCFNKTKIELISSKDMGDLIPLLGSKNVKLRQYVSKQVAIFVCAKTVKLWSNVIQSSFRHSEGSWFAESNRCID